MSILKSALTIMIPILFAACGGVLPALGGSLNIALEGLILIGAFSSFSVFYFTGSTFMAITAAAAAGIIFSLIHALTVFKLKADNIISGLAVNLLSAGICVVLSDKIFNTKGVVTINSLQFKINNDLVYWFLTTALIIIIVLCAVIYKTPFGFRLRACDKNAGSLMSLSINPKIYLFTSMLVCGFLCGIGGSFLSLNLGSFVQGMSSGKGWIALVVIFLAARKPPFLLISAFVFGLAEAFSNYAQGIFRISGDFILIFPYLFTLAMIIFVSILNKQKK